jgi:hypothetical protein
MPKSGKTTICDIVVHFLKRAGLKVTEYHGGGKYAPIDKASLGALNLYLAIKAVDFIVTNVEREKTQCRIFIMDRGIFDRRLFTRALEEMNTIDSAEASTLLRFLELPRLMGHIDGVFLFLTRPDLSLAREYSNKLIETPGRVMNETFLQALRRAGERESGIWEESAKHVRRIDTGVEDGNIVGCARLVADDISHILEIAE